jgi:hypothetical protein
MKRLIIPIMLFLALSACKEKEIVLTKPIGTTFIKGRYIIVNTDIPVPDIDVYLSSGGWPSGRELVNETVTDSNGYFEMEIPNRFDYGSFDDNYNHTGYIASRQKGGAKNTLNFSNDGQTYIQDFEMIPPAWVNVTIRNKSGRKDFEVGYVSTQRESNWITFVRDELTATKTLKIFGNMPDSLSVSLEKIVNGQDSVVERKIHMITVPGFMVKDTIIDF